MYIYSNTHGLNIDGHTKLYVLDPGKRGGGGYFVWLIVSPVRSTYGGYYGLVVVLSKFIGNFFINY